VHCVCVCVLCIVFCVMCVCVSGVDPEVGGEKTVLTLKGVCVSVCSCARLYVCVYVYGHLFSRFRELKLNVKQVGPRKLKDGEKLRNAETKNK